MGVPWGQWSRLVQKKKWGKNGFFTEAPDHYGPFEGLWLVNTLALLAPVLGPEQKNWLSLFPLFMAGRMIQICSIRVAIACGLRG